MIVNKEFQKMTQTSLAAYIAICAEGTSLEESRLEDMKW